MSMSPAGQPASILVTAATLAFSKSRNADAARRPRSTLGPPPSKTVPGKPCHLPCSKATHLPPPPTGLLRSPSPTGGQRRRGRPLPTEASLMPGVAGFGLSFGLHSLPHRIRSAAGFFCFPLGGPPTLNERPAGEENSSGDGRLMKNNARWHCRAQTWMTNAMSEDKYESWRNYPRTKLSSLVY